MRQFNNGYNHKPRGGLRPCDRTDCIKDSVRKVRSGEFTYHLCEPHADEMEVFEKSYAKFRAEMKKHYQNNESLDKSSYERDRRLRETSKNRRERQEREGL